MSGAKSTAMPNRVIKDSIWSSPTLAKLPIDVQLHWPRWLLMADDWGCFNADPDVIKGLVYPKIPAMTVKKIQDLLETYNHAGLLFFWDAGDRVWGYFTSWNGHQFCNVTHLDEDGKQLRHKRKTSEPPEIELSAYLEAHKLINQGVTGKLEQTRAVQNKYRNPNPNPNPNPSKDLSLPGPADEILGVPKEIQWGTPETLIALYNHETPDELSAVTKLSPGRITKAKHYLKAFPDKAFWVGVCQQIHRSMFLRGLKPSKDGSTFKADFDWLLTKGKDGSENCLKVFEGRYTDERRV